MSFLKKLFGIGGGAAEPAPGRSEDYEGYTITATPYEANGRWQLCGVIAKDIGGERKEHSFIRADNFATRDEAEDMTLFKARQIIDQMGERVFGA
jgi:hypothetical protein